MVKRFKEFVTKLIVGDRKNHLGWDMGDVEHHKDLHVVGQRKSAVDKTVKKI